MSRRELADAVNACIWQMHGVEEHLDEKDIGKLERGVHRWPGARRREALRRVLGADRDDELGFHIVRGIRREQRRGDQPPLATRVDSGPDVAIIDDLRAMLTMSRLLDHRTGSEAAMPMVAAQHRLVATMLETRPSAPLLELFAELQQLHGWLLFDVDCDACAVAELTTACGTARAAGDVALTAYILGPNLGLVEMYRGHPALGLEHASHAVESARRTGNQRLLSFTLAITARCCARLGSERQTRRLLDDAAAALAISAPTDEGPPWLAVFDESALLGHTGTCLLDLGAPAHAAGALGEQAARSDDMFVRNRTLWTLDLARAHIGMNEIDRARADLEDALIVAAANTSPRTSARVLAVATDLRDRLDVAATRDIVATAQARHERLVASSAAAP